MLDVKVVVVEITVGLITMVNPDEELALGSAVVDIRVGVVVTGDVPDVEDEAVEEETDAIHVSLCTRSGKPPKG